MDWVVGVVVFLLGASVGILVGIYVLVWRTIERVEGWLGYIVERYEALHAEQCHQSETLHTERRDHLNATAAIVVDRIQIVGRALTEQIQQTASEHRNDLRLATGLPAVLVPDNGPPSSIGRKRRPPSPPQAPWKVPPPPPLAPRWVDNDNNDDEPTPPSGWTPEEIKNRTQEADPPA